MLAFVYFLATCFAMNAEFGIQFKFDIAIETEPDLRWTCVLHQTDENDPLHNFGVT